MITSARIILQRTSLAVGLSGYVFGLVMFAIIANDQFRDRYLLETGTKTESKISSISPRKNQTWGMIDYRLTNGVSCHDWTELAPNGVVRPGESLTVAIEATCGRSVSTKKRLTPWIFVCLCIGETLFLLYVILNTLKTLRRRPHAA